MNNRRIASAAALVLTGGLALTGCSSDDSSSSSTSTSSTTAASSVSATSSSAAASGEKVAGAVLAKSTLAALARTKTFEQSNQTPMTSQSSVSQVVVRPNGKMDMTSKYKVGANNVQAVTFSNGATVYAKAPAMMLSKWTKIDASTKDPVAKKVATNVNNLIAPSAPWNVMRLVAALQLTKAGEETVAGVKTTKYTADVPAKVVINIAPAEQRQLLAGVLGNKTAPLVLNVDAQGRPVRQTLTMNLGGEQTITSTWSKFGAPVTVKSPI